MSRGSRASSRARITRCTLPPDRASMGRSGDAIETPSRSSARSRSALAASQSIAKPPARAYRRVSPSARFSRTVRPPTAARRRASSGMNTTPCARIFATGQRVASSPPRNFVPLRHGSSPRITSPSSRWPFPATPATPRISCGRIARSISASPGPWPRGGTLTRSSWRIGAVPGRAVVVARGTGSATSAPNISETSMAAVASSRLNEPATTPRRSTVTRSAHARTSRSLWAMNTIA